ncbi:hypothetical protein GUJ93_ZPchr0005g15664 [Zizania palustris]|uniref:Uncharacterized protein n=1 Tax=Zizania palustris TaxID=103762 RepID=A0A8J5SI32_ZIZPA|nr:hypothetical protein GUJ93_ZPchr0005g15664 [Zizania palustris]
MMVGIFPVSKHLLDRCLSPGETASPSGGHPRQPPTVTPSCPRGSLAYPPCLPGLPSRGPSNFWIGACTLGGRSRIHLASGASFSRSVLGFRSGGPPMTSDPSRRGNLLHRLPPPD